MTATDLIATCRAAGILLEVNGDRLKYQAPAGALTPELRATLKEHKSRATRHALGGASVCHPGTLRADPTATSGRSGDGSRKARFPTQRDRRAPGRSPSRRTHFWRPRGGGSLDVTLGGLNRALRPP